MAAISAVSDPVRGPAPLGPARAATILLALLVGVMLLALSGTAQAYGEGTEVRRMADKLQCPVCLGTSVADSASDVADSMRTEIGARLEQGQSEQQIIDFFVGVYGLGVLREPPKTGWYSAVWWGPGVALALGAVMIFFTVRGKRQAGIVSVPAPPPEAAAPDDERYRAELRREIEERER